MKVLEIVTPCEKTCGCDPKPSRKQKSRVSRSKRIKLTTVVTTSAVRDSVFERDVHRHKHSSLQLAHRESRYQHRTVCSDQTYRMHRSFAPSPKILRAELFEDALGRWPTPASLSARRRAKKMLALAAEQRGKCCLVPDLCFVGVTAAAIRRIAR